MLAMRLSSFFRNMLHPWSKTAIESHYASEDSGRRIVHKFNWSIGWIRSLKYEVVLTFAKGLDGRFIP